MKSQRPRAHRQMLFPVFLVSVPSQSITCSTPTVKMERSHSEELDSVLTLLYCVCVCVSSVTGLPLRLEKMSDLEEEEDRSESPGFICQSMKSDWSRAHPPDFSNEPGNSDTR